MEREARFNQRSIAELTDNFPATSIKLYEISAVLASLAIQSITETATEFRRFIVELAVC